jgi:hypothetical protein
MSEFPYPEGLTDEQSEMLERAAYLIIKARNEAAAMMMRSRVEPPPDEGGWWGNPCGATFPPPPQHNHCGCRNYTGDGGPCLSQFIDFTGPDFGDGPPKVTCRHRPSQHLKT